MGDLIQLNKRHRHAQGILLDLAPWMLVVALIASAFFWHLDIHSPAGVASNDDQVSSQSIAGRASVVDGDTILNIDDKRVPNPANLVSERWGCVLNASIRLAPNSSRRGIGDVACVDF